MDYIGNAHVHPPTGAVPLPSERRAARCRRVLAVVATLLLAACSGPPVFDGRNRPPSAPGNLPAGAISPVPGDRIHQVARGDTVYAIARQYDLTTRDIIDANRLLPPYQLEPGQRLIIPGPRLHVVERGETLYAISRRYDVDMTSLARLNDMGPPYTIFVGQRLRLPTPGDVVRVATVEGTIGGRPVALQRDISAVRPAASPTGAVTATPLPDPPSAKVENQVESAPSPASAPQVASLPPAVDFGSGEPKSKPSAPARNGPVPPPPPSAGGFIWPVEGRVTESFGTKPGGQHNDGLNIAAPRGAPVRAVDNGVVAYAGDRIRGFGQMVLLKHANGLITAYAHNETLLVQRGDVVNRGQVIARVGSTGGVPTPQLHFEVRKGTVAVDPARYLPG